MSIKKSIHETIRRKVKEAIEEYDFSMLIEEALDHINISYLVEKKIEDELDITDLIQEYVETIIYDEINYIDLEDILLE